MIHNEKVDESDAKGLQWITALDKRQNERFLKLLDNTRTKQQDIGTRGIDYVLKKLCKRKPFPDWLISIGHPIVDHAMYINDNLIILYPYGFHQNQFLELAKHANSNKFYIQVNATSRGGSFCLRIILWKLPNHVLTKNR